MLNNKLNTYTIGYIFNEPNMLDLYAVSISSSMREVFAVFAEKWVAYEFIKDMFSDHIDHGIMLSVTEFPAANELVAKYKKANELLVRNSRVYIKGVNSYDK